MAVTGAPRARRRRRDEQAWLRTFDGGGRTHPPTTGLGLGAALFSRRSEPHSGQCADREARLEAS